MLASVIKVSERTGVGSSHSRRARREGKVPVVLYGLKKEPKYFLVEEKELEQILNKDINVVKLTTGKSEVNALIKDVQYNYLAGHTTHIDFQEIDMDKVIVAKVAVHPHGTAVGLSAGGVLDQFVHEIEVSCLPSNLPESISVDVSGMDLGDTLHISDVKMPANVEAAGDLATALFHVGLPKVKVEAETTATETAEAAEGATETKAEGATESKDGKETAKDAKK